VQAVLAAFNLNTEQAAEVERVLLRICQAIAEIGYEAFLEDVIDKDFAPGAGTPVGSVRVTLVPGPRPPNSADIVVGVSKGNKNRTRLGFPRVMQEIKTLLNERKSEVEFVMVIADTWDSESFRSQHLSDLGRFAPVPFLFLLVGSPDNLVAPVAVVGRSR
jgi:hypothetical protein